MKKVLKRVFSGILAGVVVLIAAVVIIPLFLDFNDYKEDIAAEVKARTGRNLFIDGDIRVSLLPSPKLAVEGIRFANMEGASAPDMVSLKAVEVRVALTPLLSKTVDVESVTLVEPRIELERTADGGANWEISLAGDPAPEEAEEPAAPAGGAESAGGFNIQLDRVAIENGALTYRDATTGLIEKIENINATVRAADVMKGPFDIQGDGIARGVPLDYRVHVGDMAPGQPISVAIALNSKVGQTAIEVNGEVSEPGPDARVDATIKVQGTDLAELIKAAANLSVPPFLGQDFDVSAALTRTGSDVAVKNLNLALGETRVRGAVTVNLGGNADARLGGDKWRVVADLTSELIDLRPLLPQGRESVAEPSEPAEPKDKVFPDDPLPLDALNQVDAEVKIRAKQILTPRLRLKDVTIGVTVRDGRLTVNPLKALVGGGTLDGRFEVRTRQGNVAVMAAVVKVDQLDLGNVLKDLDVNDILEGKLDVDIDVKGRGGSVAALMGSLDGTTSIVMGKGRIDNEYIDLVGADLGAIAMRLLNPFEEEANYTELNCFVSRFDVTNGLADSTAMVLDTSRMSLVGDGEVNLKTEEIDLSMKPSPKEGAGNLGFSLAELTKPFKLGGTLANPSLVIDPTESAIAIGKAVGSVALFGPVGIAAALVSGGSSDENPCLAAIEAAEQGVTVAREEETSAEDKGVVEKTSDAIKDAVEGLGDTLKGLFGVEPSDAGDPDRQGEPLGIRKSKQ